MAVSPRSSVVGALAGVSLLLAGCGGDASGARSTIGTVQTTSYVVEDPVTTTTTTTLPAGVTVPGGEISAVEQTYIIKSGDSVSRIASLHGITMDVLVNYNGWSDGINHFLVVGDEVKIPPNSKVPGAGSTDSGSTGTDTGAPDPTDVPTDSATDGDVACEHTVVANDNPSRLADQYGVSLDELSNANVNNPAYTRFLIGDKINIPAGGDC